MRILGIETSCDESAIALVEGEGKRVSILKNFVSSQIAVHAKYGGVIPEVAARQHVQVLAAMLKESGITSDDVDVIAVTSGPGLITALRVGIDAAKALAWAWKKPLLGVNHIEGHVYANWISEKDVPAFPALCLIVSGGHTELVLMRGFGEYERLGETQDDAVGEAFDKVAKLLGLPYPGGPQVSKRSENGNATRFDFPRPMMNVPGYDFSYSGLKTAVRIAAGKLVSDGVDLKNDEAAMNDLCASFQAAAVEPLVGKSERAIRAFENSDAPIASLILAGGVSANKMLRAEMAQLAAEYQIPIFMPELKLTGDNAAMIAAAGYFRASEANVGNINTVQADSGWRLGA